MANIFKETISKMGAYEATAVAAIDMSIGAYVVNKVINFDLHGSGLADHIVSNGDALPIGTAFGLLGLACAVHATKSLIKNFRHPQSNT